MQEPEWRFIEPMELQLQRPLVVFDLESTGLNPHYDRIVEIAALKVWPDGRQEHYEKRVNPERPIPPRVVRIHGISNQDVAGAPTFREIAGEICGLLHGSDLAGFGILQFDIPLLTAELKRVGVELDTSDVRVVDSKVIYHKREPRTLSAALEFYCNEEHTDAHGAMEGQLQKYPDLAHRVDELDAYCNPQDQDDIDPDGKLRWSDDEVILDFGQKKGIPLRQMAHQEPQYLEWMLRKDFSDDVKDIVQDALNGVFPRRKQSR